MSRRHPCGFGAAIACLSLGAIACGQDDLRIANRLSALVTLNVRAPRLELKGGCEEDFRTRFCAEEYEQIGIVEVAAGEDRLITIFDAIGEDQCTNVLWLQTLSLGDIGPVVDPGTSIQLPSEAEIEEGAGRQHTVAFPQGTLRIDEVGDLDQNQGPEPPTCAALGRAAR